MFGNDANKRTGRPVKGYRWMYFTFLMILLLCLIVIFHDSFEKAKKSVGEAASGAVKTGFDWTTKNGDYTQEKINERKQKELEEKEKKIAADKKKLEEDKAE